MDHPHVCGKYSDYMTETFHTRGSPPRMWEVHMKVIDIEAIDRITPTYVGSTDPHNADGILAEDHPHVCGKYSLKM